MVKYDIDNDEFRCEILKSFDNDKLTVRTLELFDYMVEKSLIHHMCGHYKEDICRWFINRRLKSDWKHFNVKKSEISSQPYSFFRSIIRNSMVFALRSDNIENLYNKEMLKINRRLKILRIENITKV